jgi:hypothetical protein
MKLKDIPNLNDDDVRKVIRHLYDDGNTFTMIKHSLYRACDGEKVILDRLFKIMNDEMEIATSEELKNFNLFKL